MMDSVVQVKGKALTGGKAMILFRSKYLSIYLAVICCIIVLFSAGMRQGRKAYVDRQGQYVQERVDNIVLETISLLEPYYQLCEEIAANRTITSLGGSRLSSGDIRRVQEIYDSGRLAALNIKMIAVYFADSNTIITNGRVYENSQVNDFYDQYGRMITSRYLSDDRASVYRSVRGDDFQLLTRKLYDSSGIMGCLILECSFEGIDAIATDDMPLYIGNNHDYMYAGAECSDDMYRTIVAGANAKDGISVNGEKCYVPTTIYSKLNTAIRVVVSEQVLHAGSGIFCFWYWGGILLCVLLSIPLAVYFHFHLLVPARELAGIAAADRETSDIEGVMASAGRKIRALEEKISHMIKDKRYFLPLAMGEKLNRVLASSGSYVNRVSADALTMMGLDPQSPCFIFAIHILSDVDGIFQNSEDERILVSSYNVMNNILTEKIFEKSAGFLCVNQDFLPVVVQKNEKITSESLEKDLDESKAFLEEYFHVKIAVSQPLLMESAAELQDAYKKTKDEITYLEFWQKERYTDSGNERSPGDRVPYFKIIRNLVNKLETKDYEGASEVFGKVIDEYMPGGQHNWRTDRYQIYALAGIIITAVYEQSGQEKFKKNSWEIVDRLYHISNINEFREECENLIEDFVTTGEDDTLSGSDKIDEIQKYILENYTDNTLNASSIAHHFGKSKSHLSHLFKDAAGINISEYIQRMRVDKAKELLAEHSVKDVVRMSGFWDTQALTRAMKKYEGITPGEFKKIKGYD